MDYHIARDAHAVAEENFLLPVDRKVVDVFPYKEVGEESCGGQSADKRGGRGGRDDGRQVALDFAAELYADDAAFEKWLSVRFA